MSILYCGLFSKTHQFVLAESTKDLSRADQIESIIPQIYENSSNIKHLKDTVKDEYLVTHFAFPTILFACVSKDEDGHDRPTRFMEERMILTTRTFFNIEEGDENLDKILEGEIKRFCYQSKLSSLYNKLIAETETGIYVNKKKIKDINSDLREIKNELNADIQKLLRDNEDLMKLKLTSENMVKEAIEYEDNARELEYQTRYIKPWMWISGVAIVVLFLAYTIIALVRCGSMNIFCKTDRERYIEQHNKGYEREGIFAAKLQY